MMLHLKFAMLKFTNRWTCASILPSYCSWRK